MSINNLKVAALVALLTTGLCVSSTNAGIDVANNGLNKIGAAEDK